MCNIPADESLRTHLICYGSKNEFWLCHAEDRNHAVEQFESAEIDGEIKEVFDCVPATTRHLDRQRRAERQVDPARPVSASGGSAS